LAGAELVRGTIAIKAKAAALIWVKILIRGEDLVKVKLHNLMVCPRPKVSL
jgi:hypothetical protein